MASQVTQILQQLQTGDLSGAEQLSPLVYDEPRKLAALRLATEGSGQTQQANALVHESYVRLADRGIATSWNSRGHFFAARAEAMRRILVVRARRKLSIKHGGECQLLDVPLNDIPQTGDPEGILAFDVALEKLGAQQPIVARFVELRYFAGTSQRDAAASLGISGRTAQRYWSYAKAFLLEELSSGREH